MFSVCVFNGRLQSVQLFCLAVLQSDVLTMFLCFIIIIIIIITRLTAFFSGTIRMSQYQKGKTNLDFTEARDSEWQWHQLGRMQVCTSLQTDNHASTPPLSLLQVGRPSCHPTNSVKALKVLLLSVFADVKKINKC